MAKWLSIANARLAFVACLVAAGLMAASLLIQEPGIGYDGEQYIQYARHMVDGHGFTFDGLAPSCGRAPGYPALIAIVLWATGDIAILYPLQMAMLFGAFCLVKRTFEEELSLHSSSLQVILLGLLVPLHGMALKVQSEPLFLFVLAAGILFFTRGVRHASLSNLIIGGLLIGLAAYVRPVALLLAPFLGAFFAWRKRLSLTRAAIVVIAGILTVLPWTVRNYVQFQRVVPMAAHTGSFYYMTDAEVFWPVLINSAGYTHTLPIHREIVGEDLELDLAANDRYWQRGVANIRQDPLGFLKRCVYKTIFVWSYLPGTKSWLQTNPVLFAFGVLVQMGFLTLSVLGWRHLNRRAPTVALAIAGLAIYTAAVLFPFYAESRFLLPVYVWLVGLVLYWLVDAAPEPAGDGPRP